MDNNIFQIKVKERLNKLDSSDYPNLPCWTIAEAANKAQIQVVRRMLQVLIRLEQEQKEVPVG